MCRSRIILRLLLSATALLSIFLLMSTATAFALTVNEVARELACPCECPLVLEDCNMSCGLDWKNKIGEKIAEGKTKNEIVGDFFSKYGDACKITPLQRINGKFFQYTRAFGTMEWVIFWSVIVLWTGAIFLGIYLLVRKALKKKSSEPEAG